MTTYKLLRIRNGKLYPLYVEADREMKIGEWLKAGCGKLVDDRHVKASGCGGKLALRPGFHSTFIPFTDWIGKRVGNKLVQRKDTVWCECEVSGEERWIQGGSRELVDGWYQFKTNAKQKHPWVISNTLKINRILSREEVETLCFLHGCEAQEMEA